MQGLENLFLQTSTTGYTFTFHDFTDSLQIGVLLVLWATLWIFIKQTKIQKVQLETSNYLAIFQKIDDPISKSTRRVIYRSHSHICELVKDYHKKDEAENEVLDSVNEAAKHIVGIYDSIWFLVKDNKELEEKLIEHHGLTMGRLWKILQGLHQTWIDRDFVKAYVGFRTLGTKSYDKNKEDVERYFENNYKKVKPLDGREIIAVKNKILGIDKLD